MNEDRAFLDNGYSLPLTLDKKGTSTRMTIYEENIWQSLWMLLIPHPAACLPLRLRLPHAGYMRIYGYLVTQQKLRDEIERASVLRTAALQKV